MFRRWQRSRFLSNQRMERRSKLFRLGMYITLHAIDSQTLTRSHSCHPRTSTRPHSIQARQTLRKSNDPCTENPTTCGGQATTRGGMSTGYYTGELVGILREW